jgi:hypothetical protein
MHLVDNGLRAHAPGQTIHALLQVSDNGTPALTSFQRVIVTAVAQ